MSIAAGSVSSRTSGGKKDGKSFSDVDEGVDVEVTAAVDARRNLEAAILARTTRARRDGDGGELAREETHERTHGRVRSFADRSSVRRGRRTRRRLGR